MNVLIIEPLALTDALNEFKLAVEVYNEDVIPLNSENNVDFFNGKLTEFI